MTGTEGEYVVFNVIDVPISGADGLEQAFAQRQSHLSEVEGFAGFELLRREDKSQFVVVSRWRNEAAFTAWLWRVARKSAEAGKEGGFLGFGGVAVSDAEKATLEEIATALGNPAGTGAGLAET